MSIESAADRAALFHDAGELALFGEVVAEQSGTSVVISVERNIVVIFDRAYREDLDSSGFRPVALVTDADVQYIKRGHKVLLKGQVFTVRKLEPDGLGLTLLVLHLQGPYLNLTAVEPGTEGYPYTYPFPYSSETADAASSDSLAYPYTVETHLDPSTAYARWVD